MGKSQRGIPSVFGKISEAISRLSDEDYQKLLDSSTTVQLVLGRSKASSKAARPQQPKLPPDNQPLADEDAMCALLQATSRVEAQNFLEGFSRRSLTVLARKLDIQSSQRDSLDTLRQKIVEATVGARLRSDAIQGKLHEAQAGGRNSLPDTCETSS